MRKVVWLILAALTVLPGCRKDQPPKPSPRSDAKPTPAPSPAARPAVTATRLDSDEPFIAVRGRRAIPPGGSTRAGNSPLICQGPTGP